MPLNPSRSDPLRQPEAAVEFRLILLGKNEFVVGRFLEVVPNVRGQGKSVEAAGTGNLTLRHARVKLVPNPTFRT